ncbi:MAG: ankyrin repeat domain-containing protein [Candidatus Zixiibacteriota bacterium]|nr:MAG: ankyrin repeat domain-containing protein [candidate division Zixibacteria bacterium]
MGELLRCQKGLFRCCLLLIMLAVPAVGGDLHQAAADNDLRVLRELLDREPDIINSLDSNHMTPVNLAAQSGNGKAVKLLIQLGADLTIGDADNSSPIHLAALGGHNDIIKVLLEAGVDIDVRDNNGSTALIHAIASRNYETAISLIDLGADVSEANKVGDSPLHWAVARHAREVVDRLLISGADINLRTNEGNTPLSYAALVSDTAIARTLINSGADLEIKDNWDRTPLSLIARERGNLELAKLLITAGARVNTFDESADTPLMLAAWRGFESLVNEFLDNDAELPSVEDKQRELIGYAASHGMERLFETLVEAGAEIDFDAPKGGTLLHTAAAGTSEGIVARLVRHGLGMNGKDAYGRTPLHYAAERGRENVLRYLLEQGADVNARSLSGRTPLNLAEEFNHNRTADILKQGGAEPALIAFPQLTGLYMGQTPPGTEPEIFAPDIVSTHNFEHGCITFSPNGREAFWTSSVRLTDSGYVDCFIMTSHVENGKWTLPEMADFSTLESDDDVPFFSPDGERLYFLSRRNPGGVWYIERTGDGWSEPRHIEGGPSKKRPYWQISVSSGGSIYIGSGGDIWVSRLSADGYEDPLQLSSPITTSRKEGHPCIAPDESFLIYQIEDEEDAHASGLYISFRDDKGNWMGPTVLEPGGEPLRGMCPVLSPDGKYLFFNDWRMMTNDIYWVEIGTLIDSLRSELLK